MLHTKPGQCGSRSLAQSHSRHQEGHGRDHDQGKAQLSQEGQRQARTERPGPTTKVIVPARAEPTEGKSTLIAHKEQKSRHDLSPSHGVGPGRAQTKGIAWEGGSQLPAVRSRCQRPSTLLAGGTSQFQGAPRGYRSADPRGPQPGVGAFERQSELLRKGSPGWDLCPCGMTPRSLLPLSLPT